MQPGKLHTTNNSMLTYR